MWYNVTCSVSITLSTERLGYSKIPFDIIYSLISHTVSFVDVKIALSHGRSRLPKFNCNRDRHFFVDHLCCQLFDIIQGKFHAVRSSPIFRRAASYFPDCALLCSCTRIYFVV